MKIISDRGPRFTSKFWMEFRYSIDTFDYVHNFPSPFHPQTYGQIKRVHRILEDMLVIMLVLLNIIRINSYVG